MDVLFIWLTPSYSSSAAYRIRWSLWGRVRLSAWRRHVLWTNHRQRPSSSLPMHLWCDQRHGILYKRMWADCQWSKFGTWLGQKYCPTRHSYFFLLKKKKKGSIHWYIAYTLFTLPHRFLIIVDMSMQVFKGSASMLLRCKSWNPVLASVLICTNGMTSKYYYTLHDRDPPRKLEITHFTLLYSALPLKYLANWVRPSLWTLRGLSRRPGSCQRNICYYFACWRLEGSIDMCLQVCSRKKFKRLVWICAQFNA